MINTVILTNIPSSVPHCKVVAALHSIQKVAGKQNMRIVHAVIDRSGDDEELCEEPFHILEDMMISAKCDAILVDDSYGYSYLDSYRRLEDMADVYNTPVYHFGEDEIFMSGENQDFDYDNVPFEVYEMKVFDTPEEFALDQFADEIEEVQKDFENRVADHETFQRHDEILHFAEALTHVADILLKKAADMNKQVKEELLEEKKKLKRK